MNLRGIEVTGFDVVEVSAKQATAQYRLQESYSKWISVRRNDLLNFNEERINN